MSKYNPLISVIMSVYNNELYIEEAITSILNQTYQNFELLITDDCSSDASFDIIEKFSLTDRRIRVIRNEKNIGLTRSLNNMINLAKGELIARMDGDDICYHNRFEKQVSIFEENDVDLIFTNTDLIDFKGNFICHSYKPNKVEKILKMLKIHNYIPHPTVIFKRDLIKKYGGYNEDAINSEDQDLWVRFNNNNVKFYFLNENLIKYRINPNSVRKTNSRDYYKLASICILNKNRIKSLEYFRYLNFKEKTITSIKLILPRNTMYLKEVIGIISKKIIN